jgi:hypothetical protein
MAALDTRAEAARRRRRAALELEEALDQQPADETPAEPAPWRAPADRCASRRRTCTSTST